MKRGILFFAAVLAFAGTTFGAANMPTKNGSFCDAHENGQFHEISFCVPAGKVLRSMSVYQWSKENSTWVDLTRCFRLRVGCFSKGNVSVLQYDQGGVNTVIPDWSRKFCLVPTYY